MEIPASVAERDTAVARLNVVFLVGQDDVPTRLCIEKVCEVSSVLPVAVLLDSEKANVRKRLRNLGRNLRREGIAYILHRTVSALGELLERWAARVISQSEVESLLRRAFPGKSFSFLDLAEKYDFKILEVGNLNGPVAVERIRECRADLGIVVGTRILKASTFRVPRQGCINLHKGKVPEYRGLPPGFWELYEGGDRAGLTVHVVDDGVDTGDVLGTSEVPIDPNDTPESLETKLDLEGARLLASVVSDIQGGSVTRRPQAHAGLRPRSKPTRAQRLELQRRLPHWRLRSEAKDVVKMAFYLMLLSSGIYSLVRWFRRRSGTRAAILLYHRVNDVSADVLTTSTRRFAEHLVALSRYYHVAPTSEVVECLASGRRIQSTTVAIHFDDCYRDVYSHAAPLLHAAGMPATAFVSSRFVNSSLAFPHDQKCPHRFENLRDEDLHGWMELGFDIGSHTASHADLGKIDLGQARVEVFESRKHLQQLTGADVRFFSFPYGNLHNMRESVRQLVREAGYGALFSAYGGFICRGTSLFDVPRFGVNSDHMPLYLMMEIEGLTVRNLLRPLWRAEGRPADGSGKRTHGRAVRPRAIDEVAERVGSADRTAG